MAAKSCAEFAHSSPREPLPGLLLRSFSPHPPGNETYAGLSGGHPVSFAVFKQARGIITGSWLWSRRNSPCGPHSLTTTLSGRSFARRNRPFSSNEVSLTVDCRRKPGSAADSDGPRLGGRARTLSSGGLPGLLEFLFKAEYAYDMGMPQWVARVDHVLSPLRLERLFLGRHKIFHFRIWYRDALAGYVREMLLDSRSLSRPYIERKSLEVVIRVISRGIR